jgi:Chitobiase/beta-hexosaminidase C-terminal domain/Legume lectin domain
MSKRRRFARFVPHFPASATANLPRQLMACSALLLGSLCLPAGSVLAQTPTPVTVPTWRYDLTHSGANKDETALTTANVNVNTFGKLFALSVDGSVYAQPLYVPGLTMSDGQVHNVLFVATENDSIYAFDADTNGGVNAKPIWQISLLTAAHGASAGATAIPYLDAGSPDIAPVIGITGTPAINTATNTMYVVSNTKENGVYFSRLHAINILTGAEQPKSPIVITGTVAGTGQGSSGGQLAFDPLVENQRPALDYYNGYVYVGYAAHGDVGAWHGWLFAYNATTLAQTAMICLSPNGTGSGIWGSGAGFPIEDTGSGARMFVSTGNGPHTPGVTFPYSGSTGYGESVLDFSLANGGLTATDDFTAFNYSYLNDEDLDLGSGGVLLVPDQEGTNPPVLIIAGKEGRILVLDRDNLGGYAPGGTSNTNALQDIPGEIQGLWGTPAYWDGKVFFWAENDVPKIFDLDNDVLNPEQFNQSTITSAFPSPTFSISSNGDQEGIAWAVRSDQFNTHGPLVLYAWDATNLSTPLYESDTDSARDAGGAANRYSIPMVTNGKVYVTANGEVDVYGLFNGEPNAANPVITPNGGTFGSNQQVTLSTATATASIYYTLDGSVPSSASTLYTGPITIGTQTTLKAVASATGYIQSGVTTATFYFTDEVPSVKFTPAGGTYNSEQQVAITDPDANAKIYYTTDGSCPIASNGSCPTGSDASTPAPSAQPYTGPIRVSISQTIQAVGIDPSFTYNHTGKAQYVINAGGQMINFGNGFSETTGLSLNGNSVATDDTRLQLTNGGQEEAGSVFWTTPISIQAFTTDFEFQLLPATADGFTFTIQNTGATAVGSDGSGLGYQGIGKSVAIKFNFYNSDNEGADSTGLYTDGEAPTLPTIDLTPSGIVLNSGDSIKAHVTYDGTTLTWTLTDQVTNDTFTTSKVINIPQVVGGNTAYVGFTASTGLQTASQKLLNWTYITQALPPTFSPAAGTYSSAQEVAVSSATTDSAIYYTTDGSAPNGGSALYSAPVSVPASETVQAIAISPTMGTSMPESAAYTIQASTSPTFTLSATAAADVVQGSSTTANITITPANGFTGMVALTCAISSSPSGGTDLPTCSVSQPAAISGSGSVTSALTINTESGTTAGNYAVTVTGTSGSVVETASIPFTVKIPSPAPGFALSGTAVSISSPGTTATSTISVTPSNGFTGSVALTCAVTSSPTGAIDPPGCSVTQPASIAGTAAVTATLTVTTTAASTAALHNRLRGFFGFGGGGVLAAFLFFCVPFRRRKWQSLFGLLIFFAIAAAAIGCGGGNTGGGGGSGGSGTSAGSYTVTVTGTAGSAKSTTTVMVNVQ